MGKGRRKGGKASSGRSGGGRSHLAAGGVPPLSSFSGMINPAALAAAARDAARHRSVASPPPAASPAKASSKKKRRRSKTDPASNAGLDVGHSKKRKMDGGEGGIKVADGIDTSSLLIFGHPRWTDLQQLVRLLLFPPTSQPMKQKNPTSSRPVLQIVFVSQADQVRELALLCKPLLHPFPVVMVHNKAKRNQIQDGVREVLASLTAEVDGSVIATRGPVIFVADSALDRLVSAFRSCRTADGSAKNGKPHAKGEKKKKIRPKASVVESNILANKTSGCIGIHFDFSGSVSIQKTRTASLDAVATALQATNIDAASTSGAQLLEISLDGKRTNVGSGQDGSDIFSGGISGHCASVATAIPSNQWIPQQTEQQIVEGVVNSAKRVREGPVGSPRERSAKEKLLARMVVLDARLQAKARLLREGSESEVLNLPAVQGITDGKISAVVEKMRILGMIGSDSAGGKSEREAAQTRWMDNAKGSAHGGTWKGSIRYGASGDDVSRSLASKLANWKSGVGSERDSSGRNSNEVETQCLPCGEGDAWRSLMRWRPNPSSGDPLGSVAYNSEDEDDEGRRDFGSCACAKACGHNEAVMFYLRPFCALEVINSRVCSLASPAPGNQGFEGCLEYLRRMCAAAGRTMTYWDSECFALIDGRDGNRCRDGLAPGEIVH